ncbi:hypothetical protein [Aureivirga sp. CE67]|uniref:hypothetical protein n=1 Tax=Aureivirga sp. CE67 TaxID=1788983 RepID=UPI0018C9477A|nr:hypothetical protein [Aureivirga sp. CE67]
MMELNKISKRKEFNQFSKEYYYELEVDGKLLEDFINEQNPEIKKGLVPTLLNWLSDESERKVVWKRVLPKIGEKEKLPILMCSEDIDFWCTLIIVEVETDENYIYWNRFGLEDSDTTNPEEIAENVNWFENVNKMKFRRENYLKVLNEFKLRLNEEIAY